jgi:hypothetical protein
MKAKVGGLDRMRRFALGLLLLALTLTGAIGAWGWIGLVPLATASMRFCPIYPLLGIHTCRAQRES